jgi:hypothetical protein
MASRAKAQAQAHKHASSTRLLVAAIVAAAAANLGLAFIPGVAARCSFDFRWWCTWCPRLHSCRSLWMCGASMTVAARNLLLHGLGAWTTWRSVGAWDVNGSGARRGWDHGQRQHSAGIRVRTAAMLGGRGPQRMGWRAKSARFFSRAAKAGYRVCHFGDPFDEAVWACFSEVLPKPSRIASL